MLPQIGGVQLGRDNYCESHASFHLSSAETHLTHLTVLGRVGISGQRSLRGQGDSGDLTLGQETEEITLASNIPPGALWGPKLLGNSRVWTTA